MRKIMGYISAAILLLGILLLAGNQVATAGNLPWQNRVAVQSQNASAMLDSDPHKGTVVPPPVSSNPIIAPGIYSAGGVCTVIVQQLSPGVSLYVVLLPFTVLSSKPTPTTQLIAGVCSLTYYLNRKPLPVLTSTEGSVQICFAEVPTILGQTYVFDGQTWSALVTTLNTGMECAPASETGHYVLASQTTQSYINQTYGFAFVYPNQGQISNSTATGAHITLPFTSGTNLVEKYLDVNVATNATAATCVGPNAQGYSQVTFNGINFEEESGEGHTTGNIFDWVAYSTLKGTNCISLTLTLHSIDPGVLPTPPPIFNMQAELAVITNIVSSFTFLSP